MELPIVKAQNSEEFEIVQEDGQKLPEWIKIDPFTGQIIAEPPSDVENIKLKITKPDIFDDCLVSYEISNYP